MIDVGEGVNKNEPQIRKLYYMIDVGEGVKNEPQIRKLYFMIDVGEGLIK